MNSKKNGQRIKKEVKDKVREASHSLIRIGRFGYIAKGVVFVIVGILAAYSAVSAGSAVSNGTKSALKQIVELPFGQVLLIIIAVGLLSHTLWRFIQAFMDTENRGSDAKGIIARGVYGVIGLIYIGLAFSAVKIFLGVTNGGSWSKSWTAWLLSQPFGQWLVGISGVTIIVVGCYQFYRAYSAKFREKLNLDEMSEKEEIWATYIGRVGFTARGVIFGLIGFFLISAAYQADSGETVGIGGAFRTLEQQPYGVWLLGLAAVGFICYGLFMFVLAKYRRMVIE